MAKLKPYYKQIADELEHDIQNFKYRPGSKMPTEKELQDRFYVSRMTVRQAYQVLEEKGIAVMIKNKGVFVSDVTIQKNQDTRGYKDLLKSKGLESVIKQIEFEKCFPDRKVREKLGLDPDDQIYLLRRDRYVRDELVVIEKAHINAKLVPGFEVHDFSKESLYDVLYGDYGLSLAEVHDEISAKLITSSDAKAMLESKNGPALQIATTSILDTGEIIEYTEQICNYKVFSYKVITTDVPPEYSHKEKATSKRKKK